MKLLNLLFLFTASAFLFGCAGTIYLGDPTGLDVIAGRSAKSTPIYIDYLNIHEDGIAEDLSDLLNETLASEGFNIVEDDDDAAVELEILVHYFGLDEKRANKKVSMDAKTTAAAVTVGLEAAVRSDAGAQALVAAAGTTAAAVPGIGILAGSAINGVVWLTEHGEKDYFMGTTFIITQHPKIASEKAKTYHFQSSGGGHFKGRGEAIDSLNLDAKQDLMSFLLQQNNVASDKMSTADVQSVN